MKIGSASDTAEVEDETPQPSEFSVSVDSLSSGLSIYSTSDSSVDSSVESSEVDEFTAIGIDFCCLVRGLFL
jgi:hypothetical protein